jgi:small subunit ribosomal protein S16
MLKVKLTRIGKKGQPQYRVVVLEARSKRDGAYKAELGYYNPGKNPAEFRLDQAAYATWISKGAQPTATIRQLVKKLTK